MRRSIPSGSRHRDRRELRPLDFACCHQGSVDGRPHRDPVEKRTAAEVRFRQRSSGRRKRADPTPRQGTVSSRGLTPSGSSRTGSLRGLSLAKMDVSLTSSTSSGRRLALQPECPLRCLTIYEGPPCAIWCGPGLARRSPWPLPASRRDSSSTGTTSSPRLTSVPALRSWRSGTPLRNGVDFRPITGTPNALVLVSHCGEMSEWLKEHDWKSCRG